MHSALLALSGTLILAQATAFRPQMPTDSVTISPCLVTLIDEVEVPAQEQGVLVDLLAKEGQQVAESEVLAQVDDKQAQVARLVAQYKLEVAEVEAGNDINERYARAAADVARNEYEQFQEANRIERGTIPHLEVMRTWLQVRQYTLQIEQAQHDLGIAKTTVKVREAELQAADEDVARRKITAPLDGVVEEIFRRKGEWVRPGDPVLKLLRMNRLWVEGFVDASRYTAADVRGRRVVVTVPLPGGQEQFEGTIVFASSEIKAGPQFMVKAEVTNRQEGDEWILRSGMNAEMRIELK